MLPVNKSVVQALTSNSNIDKNTYAEMIKTARETFTPTQDSFERMPLENTSDCYTNYTIIIAPMPKSLFGDSFGYDMQKDIAAHMKDFYAGKIDEKGLEEYFQQCCSSMRSYRTQLCHTSGTNKQDNTQIVSQIYEIFAKENQRAARAANDEEGIQINKNYKNCTRDDDWVYYNSDYYYQCEEVRSTLKGFVSNITDKWNIDPIDTNEIEKNSKLTLDGNFDFNSGWNFIYRNQVGRSSLADESVKPPRDFKMFYKETIYPNAQDEATILTGRMEVTLGGTKYLRDIPFYTSRDGSLEGQIYRADILIGENEEIVKNQEFIEFMKQLSLFTRWYSCDSGINNIFGNFVPAETK